jgi:hypothetical protein
LTGITFAGGSTRHTSSINPAVARTAASKINVIRRLRITPAISNDRRADRDKILKKSAKVFSILFISCNMLILNVLYNYIARWPATDAFQ